MRAFLSAVLFLALLPGVVMANRLDLTEGDAGKNLILRQGDQLTVTLSTNPTTGYSWSVVGKSQGLLKQVGESRFVQSRHRPGMVGVGGCQVWTFLAVATGKTTLGFSYARSWEHGVAPVRMIEWPVTIRK